MRWNSGKKGWELCVALVFGALGCSDGEAGTAAPRADAATNDVAPDRRAPEDAGGEPDVTTDAGGKSDAAPDGGFERLFNGVNLDGITPVGIDATALSVDNGVLKCTGVPNGYWYAPGTYRNFVLRFEYRFERPADLPDGGDENYQGNSGYFLYLTGEHRVWPETVEVQGRHSDFGGVFDLGPDGRFIEQVAPDAAELRSAKRLIGEWNQVEIGSNEGAVSVTLNGRQLSTSAPILEPVEKKEGLIAFESEGVEIHWRNIEVKRLP